MLKRILITLIGAAALTGAMAGCLTRGNVQVEEGATPEQIVQSAQEAMDASRYGRAEQYYRILLERFPSNTRRVVAAKYELAFIEYKRGNLEEAKKGFREVLSYYSDPNEAALLPDWPRILSQDFMDKLK